MEFRPFFFQESRVPRDESFGTLDVPIRDCPHNLCDLVRRKIDLHDGASFRDVDMRWRMIKCVDPDLEALLTNERGH